jgi:hypothetical protein
MCMTIVRFKPEGTMSREEYRAFLEKIMPAYKNAVGLKRKYFLAGPEGSLGIYEWGSKENAEAFYNEEWSAQMKAVAGDTVLLEYTRINAILDNLSGEVDYRI